MNPSTLLLSTDTHGIPYEPVCTEQPPDECRAGPSTDHVSAAAPVYPYSTIPFTTTDPAFYLSAAPDYLGSATPYSSSQNMPTYATGLTAFGPCSPCCVGPTAPGKHSNFNYEPAAACQPEWTPYSLSTTWPPSPPQDPARPVAHPSRSPAHPGAADDLVTMWHQLRATAKSPPPAAPATTNAAQASAVEELSQMQEVSSVGAPKLAADLSHKSFEPSPKRTDRLSAGPPSATPHTVKGGVTSAASEQEGTSQEESENPEPRSSKQLHLEHELPSLPNAPDCSANSRSEGESPDERSVLNPGPICVHAFCNAQGDDVVRIKA